MIKIAKIENDKYYTPIDLANYCWDGDILKYYHCEKCKQIN